MRNTIGKKSIPRNHLLLGTSSYDRYLDALLFIWSDIKKEIPDAQLYIAYGWDLFDVVFKHNPERQEWKKGVEMLMQQEGVFHVGRIGKEDVKRLRQTCGILAYPSYFEEINCLSILEAAKEGVVPVSTTIGAIPETVKHGIFVDGNIREKETLETYKHELISLMKDEKRWKTLSNAVKKESKKYALANIGNAWIDAFNEPIEDIKVSIITPTIREGFWHSMAKNIANQTYKNIEWVIVDDHKENREELAKKYSQMFHLEMKYVRGDKAKGTYKRRLGLIRANNIGWRNAQGELLVWLQDFVYLPEDGIEAIVDVYRHNKDSLIAPVDMYYDVNYCNLENKEDWFDGREDFLGEKAWKNYRVIFKGIRETKDPLDFELNCGAIPKYILEELNGFYEFFDEGLGYDNAEAAYRAIKMGYRILIDDSIIVTCANLWQVIRGTDLNVPQRERLLNPPRFLFFTRLIDKGKIPLIVDRTIDEKLHLLYDVPETLKEQNEIDAWVVENAKTIADTWETEVIV